jgi:hypothetical protein
MVTVVCTRFSYDSLVKSRLAVMVSVCTVIGRVGCQDIIITNPYDTMQFFNALDVFAPVLFWRSRRRIAP